MSELKSQTARTNGFKSGVCVRMWRYQTAMMDFEMDT
jgi:hypothetical protein